ncbi:Endoglucanase-4 [Penicillium canariense]|uniref:Endoglucanase-4 n=1 Tax=Penicillium canariense TaxID=189055 RepID=A0A9W9LTB3_9EURO|nr:Endoglucanase-4 [Penicillium canariense]KAJ5175280.1 Endoglucanase-4 [Penicillium canariense]
MILSKVATLSAFLASASVVGGHGFVSSILADGQNYTGYLVNSYPYMSDPPDSVGWATTATDLGFEDGTEYQDPNIICHRNGTNAAISATVTAGSEVEIQWTTWPDSHHGPVITYLASCNGDCSTVDKTTLEFFKIDATGLVDDTNVPGTWATDQLIVAGNRWTVTIPSSIASGNYVMRHEIIALHSAGQQDGAQNYPQCLNLQVTGGGSAEPEGTLGEELYTETDPGILINIYTTLSSYTIPGPALYSS